VLIVIYGSSTCPRLPSTVTRVDPNTIKVSTEVRNGNGPCTMDLVPTTAAVRVPDGINDRQAVTISIDGHTSVLAAR
jgi:DNA-binding beta-propeller fold protein YncE